MIIRPHIEALGRHNPDHPLYKEHLRKQSAHKVKFVYDPYITGTWTYSTVIADEYIGALNWATSMATYATGTRARTGTNNWYTWEYTEA